MTLLELAIYALVAPVAAAWAHEFTHALVAWALGGTVHKIDLLNLYVDFSFAGDAPIRSQMVYLAPTVIGAVWLGIVAIQWDGTVQSVDIVTAIAWTVYSLAGGSQHEVSLMTLVDLTPMRTG